MKKVTSDTVHRNSKAVDEWESTFDSADTLISVQDLDHRIIKVNKSYCTFLGLTREDCIGKHCYELIHSTCKPIEGCVHQCTIKGGNVERKDYHDPQRNLDFEISTSPYFDNDNHIIGTIHRIRDITYRTRIEHELRAKQNELQEKNEALERANSELKKMIETANHLTVKAEIANAAKSQFLSNMSHEIRTPLNGLLGFTSLMRQTELSSEQVEFIGYIETCSETLLGLINNILDWSKIEAGKFELETIKFDVHHVVEKTVKTVTAQAREKNLEIITEIDKSIPEVFGDPTRLQQILLNLLGNAIKFTHEGHVMIAVKPFSQTAGKAVLLFEVSDTGIGIAPKDLTKLFTAFQQLDPSNTRIFGGTGLGLAIAKRLIEMMGGEIKVESGLGKGSIFSFLAVFQMNQSMS